MRIGTFKIRGSYSGEAPKAILVLEPKRIPTTSFYVDSRIQGSIPKQRFSSVAPPPKGFEPEEGTWVIIVRHARRKWLRHLFNHASRLVRVTYFKDDDIPAVFSAKELPWHYAVWTGGRYLWTKDLLSKVVSDVVVSTKELADRYAESKPLVWEPHYQTNSGSEDAPLVYFYHATLTHAREIKWLVPIVRRVQQAVPNAWFEIIGGESVARMFRGIPRVRVVHTMNWPDYQAYLSTLRYDVGLAPLMDTSFNRARSHTKLYQITSAGAAGIYSDMTPYSGKIIDGETGVLCKNRRYLWVRAIVALLRDPTRKKFLHENAGIWCREREIVYEDHESSQQVKESYDA